MLNRSQTVDKILIVEDSLTQAEKLKYLLERNGFLVEVACDGVTALKMLAEFLPKTIISDVMMPNLNGYELCKIVKNNKRLKEIPVILLTSLSNSEDVLFGLECKADYFLEKGCKDELILNCLNKINLLQINEFGNQKISLNIDFREKKYKIDSEPQKLMNFLLTTYEMVISKNEDLIRIDNSLKDEINERIRLEDELEKAIDVAEHANRAKSTFLANMSHEIRTPMNAILGFAQLMLKDPAMSEKQAERLNIINRSGEHLLSLINDILEISKIEAGSVSLNNKTFDLHYFLQDIQNMFRTQTDAKNIRLIFEEDDDLLQFIETDEGKLRQIFFNLLSNAVKFTNEGGIAVRAKTELIDGEYYFISEVEDTGEGISEEEMHKLFEVFQQTESGIQGGGTGLGLALSQQLSNLLGGDITTKSVLGHGSCFKVYIKIKEGHEDNMISKTSTRNILKVISDGTPKKILIVDDIMENRLYLSDLLIPIGFLVQEATNGQDAIKKFNSWHPDLIFMDMKMPIMNGYDAAREIKQHHSGQSTKIVMSTATAFGEDIRELEAYGIEGYIRKPFKVNEICDLISELLDVEYIFDDEVEIKHALNDQEKEIAIKLIPNELLKEMHEATVNAQLDLLIELIDKADDISSDSAKWLKDSASNFKYDILMELFSEGLDL